MSGKSLKDGALQSSTAALAPFGLSPASGSSAKLPAANASQIVRKSRKHHRCANASAADRGVEWAAVCVRYIGPGQHYVEGDLNPDLAGGWGHDKYCMACAKAGLS